jgi:hypothetical protein
VLNLLISDVAEVVAGQYPYRLPVIAGFSNNGIGDRSSSGTILVKVTCNDLNLMKNEEA